jgi:hypothetical protein
MTPFAARIDDMTRDPSRPTHQGTAALSLLMLYWSLIAPSTLLHYLGLKGLQNTALVLVLALGIGLLARRTVRPATLLVFAVLVALSLVNALHWTDIRYLFYWIFFTCALLLVELSGKEGVDRFCAMATRLMLVLLSGAVLAFVLARIGLPPVLTLTNPDGQSYYFFYTTFTNTYDDNVIRAAGIYDEPGAFSMYVCFVAALRHLLKHDRKTTWLILGLGFITFSLAHLIYVFFHLLAEQSSRTRVVAVFAVLALGLFAIVTSITIESDLLLLRRLALTEDTNLFAGDNRSFQLLNAWSQINDNPSVILYGLDSTCVFEQAICQEKFGPLGENPLSPLAFGGIASEGSFYVIVSLFLFSPFFGKRYLVLFGMGLLFLQRPYVMGFSYALLAVMLADVFLRRSRKRPEPAPTPKPRRRGVPRRAPE